MLDKNLKRQFVNTNRFSNYEIDKFSLLLQKGAYPYKYMDDWEKFNETPLSLLQVTGTQKEFVKIFK